MSKSIIETIKQKGYWRVVIRPSQLFYNKNRVSISKLEEIIQNTKVSLRGWDYPHIERGGTKLVGPNVVSSECDFNGEIEHWEFMTSGQFAHLFSMQEDYIIDDQQIKRIKSRFHFNLEKLEKVNKFFEVASSTYRFTEIYLFASNLAQQDEYRDVEEFDFIIELHGVKDRMLFFGEFGRYLSLPYVCNFDDDFISYKETYKKDELIAKFNELALKNIIKTFNYFDWKNPSTQVIEGDQKKLLERRF